MLSSKQAQKCQRYKQEALGQHTRSKQPNKCQQYKQEVLGQHTRSKQPQKCQRYKQEAPRTTYTSKTAKTIVNNINKKH
jgi:hypothetical protein